jgi:glycerophosphoryl diester phosphodiesterase
MPSSPSRQAELERLVARPFAHRGLHGGAIVENSPSAFRAAIAAGHGIELDVQASADGEAIVFHDYELDRLAGRSGRLADLSAAAIEAILLTGTQDRIPSLAQTLALIDGQAPLLIEVKSPGRHVDTLSRAVLRAITPYKGPVAVMSFNPEIGRWFAAHAPTVLRGLVVTEAGKKWRGWLTRRLALWRCKADFLAYDIRDLPSRFAAAQRARGLPTLTWTCRSDAQRATAAAHADQIIYEVPA